MKKLFAAIISSILVVCTAVAFTACSKSDKVKIIEIALSSEQYGVAIQKGDTEMKAKVDEVLTALTGKGLEVDGKTVTFDSIYQAEMNAQEKGELISIGNVKKTSANRANELVVVTNAEFAPFEYMVGDSFGGIDMQIAKIIADELDKELVVLHVDFEVITSELTADNGDIAMAGMTINADRLAVVDFSVPYYNTTQYIAVAADNTDFDECKTEEDVVAVLSGLKDVKAGAATAQTGYYYLTGNEAFEFNGYSNIQTTAYPSIALAVQDLANGTIQLVCGDKDTLTAAVKAINK